MVDVTPDELISNEGRVLTGFHVHICKGRPGDNGAESQGQASRQGQ
jgi:hypothetical protein